MYSNTACCERIDSGGLPVVEIMEKPTELQRIFKRVKVNYNHDMADTEVIEALVREPRVLTIVNTRRHARLLFDKLLEKNSDGIYHLSARMCPAHRKQILLQIRKALNHGSNCRVISTQLIEAGVDVDFPVVFRASAGIDSIAQAAGRCNREGRLDEGNVIVFNPEPHGMPNKGLFSVAAGLTRSTVRHLEEFNCDLLSLEAIEYYFQQLLDLKSEELDAKGILKMIREVGAELDFSFAAIAHEFQFIDSPTSSIVVPFDENAEKLMEEAEDSRYPAGMARVLQPYVVQIYQYELAALEKEGVVKSVGEFMKFLTDRSFYDFRFGLKDAKEVKAPGEGFFIII